MTEPLIETNEYLMAALEEELKKESAEYERLVEEHKRSHEAPPEEKANHRDWATIQEDRTASTRRTREIYEKARNVLYSFLYSFC